MRPWRVPYPKFGDGAGLDRVGAVARRLEINLSDFGEAGAVIVGSNGKGSTAAMTASLLREVRRGVGLFTSPHLFDLNERFNIDGEDISDEELGQHWRRITAAIEAEGLAARIGGFEFLFLIAADWFTARGCGATVWEAGIGGRLDPVRLIEARRLALTSLDFEHTNLLGDTLEAIARDKLDAAPAGARVFIGASCEAQREAIEAHCAARSLWLKTTTEDRRHLAGMVQTPNSKAGEAKLPAGSRRSTMALLGAHQADNAALAVALARDLVGDALDDGMIADGLAATRWPGRLETINNDPLIVIDVGHTPRGIEAALAGFREMVGARDAVLVCGASRDKDAGALIAAVAPGFSRIICAAARHKGASASEIAAHAALANPQAELSIAASVAEARDIALKITRARDGVIYVAGGLFLAAEFKAVHLGRDPATLAFF